MKSWIVLFAVGLLSVLFGGCSSSSSGHAELPPTAPVATAPPTTMTVRPATPVAVAPAKPAGDEVVATVDDIVITRAQLDKPLIDAYGLNMLAKIAQLEVAKKQAAQASIVVSPQDVATETDRYVNTLFNADKDPKLHEMTDVLDKAQAANNEAAIATATEDLKKERARLLDQLLSQQKISRPDFDLVMQVNTYLRKIANSVKAPLTDDNLREGFNNLYGERIRVRDISVANLNVAADVKQKLAAGQQFQVLARVMGQNAQVASLGGELPPFTRSSQDFPQQYKDVAFGLKVGEVSDPVAVGDSFHIIELEERIPPKIIKFEDVRESVRQYMVELQVDDIVKRLHVSLQKAVSENLKIAEPELKKQFQEKVANRDGDIKNKDEVGRDLEHQRDPSRTAPSTQPNVFTTPSTTPSTTQQSGQQGSQP